MSTIVLLLLGFGFALLAFQGWRSRSAANPSSSVEGFARVLAAIDPKATQAVPPVDPIEQLPVEEPLPDLNRSTR